jgi:hypothetical protein
MKHLVSIASIAFAVFSAYGAEPTKYKSPYACESQEMLQSVAQLIQNSNDLSQNLGYDFDQIRTQYSSFGEKKFVLKCEARLKLFDLSTKTTVDTLVISYQVKSGQTKNDLILSFEPIR